MPEDTAIILCKCNFDRCGDDWVISVMRKIQMDGRVAFNRYIYIYANNLKGIDLSVLQKVGNYK